MATHLHITEEWELNFSSRPLFPISTSQWSLPSQDQQSCRHLAHMCPPSTSSNVWVQERWVYTPGKGEGRGEKPARGRFLGRLRKSLVNACSSCVRKEGPCPTLSSLLFSIFCAITSLGKGNCFLPEVRPASHLEAWEWVDLGRGFLPVPLTHCI